jgi:H+-transporting ATPase
MSAQPTHTGDVHHTGTDPVHYDEKKELGGNDYAAKASTPDEDEDEDIDALIEELESQDAGVEEEEEVAQPGNARTIPEEMLQTSTRTGLTSSEVVTRRKKYGLNQMKEEKENLLLKFLGFFIGPIQFVMEVSSIFFLR